MSFEEIKDLYSSAFNVFYDNFISIFIIILNNLPKLVPSFAIIIVIKFLTHLMQPKYDGPVFDDNYAKDFDLAYDSLRGMYDSDEDFINDYMSDFTAFQDDEPELDEFVEYDMWDNYTHDRYYDDATAFAEEFEDNYSYSFDEFEGSYSDFVEESED